MNKYLGLALLLERLDDVVVLPSNLRGQAAKAGAGAARAQTDNAQGIGDNKLLDFVVHRRHTLKKLFSNKKRERERHREREGGKNIINKHKKLSYSRNRSRKTERIT